MAEIVTRPCHDRGVRLAACAGAGFRFAGQCVRGLSASVVVFALAVMAVAHAVRIVRWWLLRTLEPSLPFGARVRPFLSSMAVNNVMPFRAGDALRVPGFRRQLRSPAMRVPGTLVVGCSLRHSA